MTGRLTVNAERLRSDLESLAQIGRSSSGGIDRAAFSAADGLARQWYKDRCDAAGLELRLDGLSNMFAQQAGTWDDGPAVWTGSHIDTVPDGGPLDGALGTVAALECVRRLAEEGVELARPVRSTVFADEEGNYSHLLGSYGIAYGYARSSLDAMVGRDGDRLADALATWPWSRGEATSTRVDSEEVHSFVELHIEQGPHLENSGTPIGVVTSIVGLGGGHLDFVGRADHAGTTPMNLRRDALQAASDFLCRLPDLASSVSSKAVMTCGMLHLEPGGANIVPRLARLTLDYRDPDAACLASLSDGIEETARKCAATHDVEYRWHRESAIAPVPLDNEIRRTIDQAVTACGLSAVAIPSGAGHDAQNMAPLAPTGMIFVPSQGGRSHSPMEHTRFEYLEQGANVLLETLRRLAT
jgi:N-carbamoyl-L-amino-acid hydrolase